VRPLVTGPKSELLGQLFIRHAQLLQQIQ
jgi:hypothetical protein